jgi:hypothetical protein
LSFDGPIACQWAFFLHICSCPLLCFCSHLGLAVLFLFVISADTLSMRRH